MAFINVSEVCFKFSRIFIFIVFCSILQPSHQDLYFEALQQELEEEISSINANRNARQTKSVYDASGIEQSLTCGLNSLSRQNRRKRDDVAQGPYDWPWMAALLEKDGYGQFCGGTLLNHQYILTAAHCFAEPGSERKLENVVIRLGAWDFNEPDETKYQDYFGIRVETHDNYEPSNKHNDIALIKLERSVDYNQYVRPLCLPSVDIKPNDSSIVSGWGATSTDGEHSSVLLDVALPVVSHSDCADLYGVSNSIDKEGNICAGGEEGKDSCQGDSGGPLVIQEPDDEKRWMIVGIVSWGLNCGEYRPGVYTNVRHYLDWIGKRILDAAP